MTTWAPTYRRTALSTQGPISRDSPAQALPDGRYPLAGMDHPGIDLSGTWAATIADESTRRAFFEPSYDDREWEPVSIPGHWRTHEAFATSDGPLLHRRWFDSPDDGGAGAGVRSWLVFDGIFYLGDVWLDGTYLGDTEGYFFPHEFDVTEHVTGRAEHVLAMEVACARQTDRTAKRNLTGVFQHWDCIDPDWNPGGIWRGVRLERTGPVRISRLRVLCRDADANANRAHIALGRRPRQRRGPHGHGADDRRVIWPRAPSSSRSRWESTASSGRCAWRTRRSGGRVRWVTRCSTTCRSRSLSATTVSHRASGAHGNSVGDDARLDHVGQRRAPLPQGVEPGPDTHGARRGVLRGDRSRCRPGHRRGSRPAARARAHRPSRAVRRGRRGGPVALAGHAPAVGIRAERAQAGDPPSAEGRRSARAPSVDRDLVRAQRSGRGRRRAVRCHGPEAVRVQVRGRAAASDLQSQRARPRGEGSVREGRRQSPRRRPFRRRAALAEARRHRHARVPRLVQRRRA